MQDRISTDGEFFSNHLYTKDKRPLTPHLAGWKASQQTNKGNYDFIMGNFVDAAEKKSGDAVVREGFSLDMPFTIYRSVENIRTPEGISTPHQTSATDAINNCNGGESRQCEKKLANKHFAQLAAYNENAFLGRVEWCDARFGITIRYSYVT
ncbi:hypothetical protein GWI33_019419 [Rhynchophorus ferrugineus]|uniref:Uncharacterized protein n=1 Tax=Rhynchophorus ferrugineus TaxID=354439 RepID=A0A834M486_RHYFE|nr:hypothetical protein GWI33_019419 [Rhynchophorus ferrugineus]